MINDVDLAQPGDRELERRLEAFADLRLTPDVVERDRVRRRVMAIAHRRAAHLAANPAMTSASTTAVRSTAPDMAVRSRTPATRPARVTLRTWVGPFGATTAALLTLAILAGTAAAARPGGPLYGVSVAAERLTLPGDTAARAEAETRRLELRMSEALAASAIGDAPGAAAALTAYSSIVNEAAIDAGGDQDAEDWIAHQVKGNLPSLTSMLVIVSEPAREAVLAAIDGSTRFLHRRDASG